MRGESFDPRENKNEEGNESLTKTPSTQSAISRVKQAKHAAISKAITEGLTKEEIIRKIYQLVQSKRYS